MSPARGTRGHRCAQVSGAKRISAYLCKFCEVLEIWGFGDKWGERLSPRPLRAASVNLPLPVSRHERRDCFVQPVRRIAVWRVSASVELDEFGMRRVLGNGVDLSHRAVVVVVAL